MSTIVNRNKGSSHALIPGGTFTGVVRKVLPNGFLTVYIPRLATTYSPIEFLSGSVAISPREGDKVACCFLNSGTTDLVCISFGSSIAQIKTTLVTVNTPVTLDTFSVSEFSSIKYEVFMSQSTGSKVGTLVVISNQSSTDDNFHADASVGTFNGSVSFSHSAVLNGICSVNVQLNQANTHNTTVKIARSFCFPTT